MKEKLDAFLESDFGKMVSIANMALSVILIVAVLCLSAGRETPKPETQSVPAAESVTEPIGEEYIPDIPEEDEDEDTKTADDFENSNPIDTFLATHRLSDDTSSNMNMTSLAYAEADAWRAEYENAVSVLKKSENKSYADKKYLDAALDKMRTDLKDYVENGCEICELAMFGDAFLDPHNEDYDEEEFYGGSGAGMYTAHIRAEIYRREALRLYDNLGGIYLGKETGDFFVFDPDSFINELRKEGAELIEGSPEE